MGQFETAVNTTKITAKIFAPLYLAFDRQIAHALLRRDAFLDRMINIEVARLREDLAGKVLSEAAKRYISGCLKRMGGKDFDPLRQISIAVAPQTAIALRSVVAQHNLVRDAFLNYLIALLRSSDPFLRSLDLPFHLGDLPGDWAANIPVSPLTAIDDIQSDPLTLLHDACEERHGCGLYALRLPEILHGFSCYLPDELVPGTPEQLERADLLAMMEQAL